MEYCSVLVKRGDEMRTAEKWAALPWWKKLFTTRDRLRRSDPQCSRRNKSKNETAAEFSDRCLETFKDMARRSQQAPDGTKVRISKYLREAGEDWIRLESRFRALEAANRGAPFR